MQAGRGWVSVTRGYFFRARCCYGRGGSNDSFLLELVFTRTLQDQTENETKNPCWESEKV